MGDLRWLLSTYMAGYLCALGVLMAGWGALAPQPWLALAGLAVALACPLLASRMTSPLARDDPRGARRWFASVFAAGLLCMAWIMVMTWATWSGESRLATVLVLLPGTIALAVTSLSSRRARPLGVMR